jgi:hypothetical protein
MEVLYKRRDSEVFLRMQGLRGMTIRGGTGKEPPESLLKEGN